MERETLKIIHTQSSQNETLYRETDKKMEVIDKEKKREIEKLLKLMLAGHKPG